MASDDSRLQELLNMQNTANMSTSPAQDQPTGQFSGDDIEFEAFMFDRGTGPLTPPAAMNMAADAPASTQVSPVVPGAPMSHMPAEPSAPTTAYAPAQPVQPAISAPAASAFEITGREVPVPSYLRTAEPQQPEEQQPYKSPPMPRGTGPLGGVHTTSHLSARLAQLQTQAPQQEVQPAPETPTIRGTGPLSRRGTGPLEGAATGSSGATGSDYSAPQQAPRPPGPINQAYFKTPTGPLTRPATEGSTAGAIPRISSTGLLNSAFLRQAAESSSSVMHSPNSQPWQASPTTWSDSALAAIEDFSAVLLSMHATRPSSVSLLPNTTVSVATYETTPATGAQREQDWRGQAFESTYSATNVPTLEEPPTQVSTQVPQPGWGDMTGAPPTSDYAHDYGQVATPDYDGPKMGYAVPMEKTAVPPIEQSDADYAEPQMQTEQAEQVETPAYNSINPNDLQFEGFMFNEGASTVSPVGPPLPGMEEFMPAVVSMEAAFEGPTPTAAYEPVHAFEPESATQQAGMEEEPAPFDPTMQMELDPATHMAVQSEQQMAQPELQGAQAIQSAHAAQDMPTAQAEVSDQGPLPFWLQDTSDLEAIARQGYMNVGPVSVQPDMPAPLAMQSAAPLDAPVYEAIIHESITSVSIPVSAPMEEVTLETAMPSDIEAFAAPSLDMPSLEPAFTPYSAPEPEVGEVAEVAEPQDQSFYEDLPPIEPFDFSSLGLVEEEEELGFNTEELTGMMPSRHDPMRATADLDVLADIFDGAPVGNPIENRPAFLRTSPLLGLPVEEASQDVEGAESSDMPQVSQSPYPAPGRPVAPSLPNATSPIASFLMPSSERDMEDQPAPAQTTDMDGGHASGGWTSMVTTALSMDATDQNESQEIDMLGAAPAGETESLPDLGLDVEPFDYTQLNLEQEQEAPTGMLDSRLIRKPGGTGDLVMPNAQSLEAASPWTERTPDVEESGDDDEESWKGTERDTSLFMSTSPRLNERGKSSRSTRSTRWPTDDGVPDTISQETTETKDMPAPQQASGDEPVKNTGKGSKGSKGVKARVASADAVEADVPNAATGTEQTTSPIAQDAEQTPAKKSPATISKALFASELDTQFDAGSRQPSTQQESPAPAPAEPVYNYQPMQGYDAGVEPRIEMPKIGAVRDIYTSGPLPELEGFESLRMLVDNNPDDIGAHIALAAAYTQLGDPDTALRVYHRVLKKRAVSDSILRLITEELNDYEAELQGNAKYHQVRGDLYTRQGRHQEAIREYNKIV